jgi:hypothetical protein
MIRGFYIEVGVLAVIFAIMIIVFTFFGAVLAVALSWDYSVDNRHRNGCCRNWGKRDSSDATWVRKKT